MGYFSNHEYFNQLFKSDFWALQSMPIKYRSTTDRFFSEKTGLFFIDEDLDFSKGNGWHHFIPYINSITNSRKSRRTNYKLCPFEMFLDQTPRSPIDWKLKGIEPLKKRAGGRRYVGWIAGQLATAKDIADKELAIYDQKRKAAYDKDRNEIKFKVGDKIKVWNGPYPATGWGQLKVNWRGPYIVLETFNEGINLRVQSLMKPDVIDVVNIKRISMFKAAQSEVMDEKEEEDVQSAATTVAAVSDRSPRYQASSLRLWGLSLLSPPLKEGDLSDAFIFLFSLRLNILGFCKITTRNAED